ncbi:chloride intracellular channel exl-1-like [Babylonia areolata]|uniref:chloride intracellular channel exl-1-like n=1 Tax=Babylonia areolata TaxID=304850 RepID=UPI003FD5CAFC
MSAQLQAHSVPTNHVVLYVKAGWDGVSYGACPFCQRFYMVLDLKARAGSLTYDVIAVNMARPLPEFKRFASKLPVLKHGEEVVMDGDEMMQYIDDNFPEPDLRYENGAAHSACLDIFSKFSFYVKNVSHTEEHLLKELLVIDQFLERAGTRYLCGDALSHLDCLMLPKLQHIRVAAAAFKDFRIPPQLTSLWRYLAAAYASDTFRKTCPSDQEIVHHWSEKRETTPLPEAKRKNFMLDSDPTFTLSVPQVNGN